MRRLILDGPGAVHWEGCDEPTAGPGQAMVRPLAVATCDLDVAVLHGVYPLTGPYPFGHEAVAEVTAIGDGVTTVTVGDRVIVPFQISCGACDPCRRGRTGNCDRHPPLSTYGLGPMGGLSWGGLLTDLALVPHADAMLVPLPDGLDPVVVASASDNIADAYRTVGPQLAAEPGAEVLVVAGEGGPASIGLYAAGLAVALGSSRVVYVDDAPERQAIASSLGLGAGRPHPLQGRCVPDHGERRRRRGAPSLRVEQHGIRRHLHERRRVPCRSRAPNVPDVLAVLHVAHRPCARATAHPHGARPRSNRTVRPERRHLRRRRLGGRGRRAQVAADEARRAPVTSSTCPDVAAMRSTAISRYASDVAQRSYDA